MEETKQFDIAIDITKQLLTLSTAVVALTVSFWKDVIDPAHIDTGGRYLIVASWLMFLFSILSGLWCLYAINGSVARAIANGNEKRSIYDGNIKIPMGGQQVTFLLAIAATVAFGIETL